MLRLLLTVVPFAAACSPAAEDHPVRRQSTGSVRGPSGTDLDGLLVLVSRNNLYIDQARVAADGAFVLNVPGIGPFDLQVADLGEAASVPTLPGDDVLLQVGRLEGIVRGVPWGAQGVSIQLREAPRATLIVKAVGPDGEPMAGAEVRLRSLAAHLGGTTDATGELRFEDLPVRSWCVLARGGGVDSRLVFGREELTPDEQVHVVRIPRGFRMEVRPSHTGAVGSRAYLEGEDPLKPHTHWVIPWRPDAGGGMDVLVSPTLESLWLRLVDPIPLSANRTRERTLGSGVAAVGPDAVLELVKRAD